MQSNCRLWFSLSFLLSLILLISCDSITKNELLPVLTTTEITTILQNTATSGGVITSDGGSSVIARGVCWSRNANPTITDSKTTDGAGIGIFSSNITGLTENTNYFVRAYATTNAGTGYGGAYQIKTKEAIPVTITDADGNIYHTVTIGNQTWMVENLKTTKYNDGTSIPNITVQATWEALTTSAYCNYNNDESYVITYGRLYNWYTVNTGILAPKGWHVATDAEWIELADYINLHLGISGSVAKALSANTNWRASTTSGSPGNNLTTNNSSGFSALPGGLRSTAFYRAGDYGHWWSSTENVIYNAWYRSLIYDGMSGYLGRNYNFKYFGYSVRCVWDK